MPIETDSLSILCAHCGSTVARVNSKGHMHCGDCSQYVEPAYQDFLPLPSDDANAGYSLADVCCPRCCGIMLALREKQPAPVLTSSA